MGNRSKTKNSGYGSGGTNMNKPSSEDIERAKNRVTIAEQNIFWSEDRVRQAEENVSFWEDQLEVMESNLSEGIIDERRYNQVQAVVERTKNELERARTILENDEKAVEQAKKEYEDMLKQNQNE